MFKNKQTKKIINFGLPWNFWKCNYYLKYPYKKIIKCIMIIVLIIHVYIFSFLNMIDNKPYIFSLLNIIYD